jgi:hypothetical protein
VAIILLRPGSYCNKKTQIFRTGFGAEFAGARKSTGWRTLDSERSVTLEALAPTALVIERLRLRRGFTNNGKRVAFFDFAIEVRSMGFRAEQLLVDALGNVKIVVDPTIRESDFQDMILGIISRRCDTR